MSSPRPVALLCGPGAFGGAQRYLVSLLGHLPADLAPVLLAVGPLDPALAAGAAATGRPVRELGDPGAATAAVTTAVTTAVAAAVGRAGAVHVNCTDPVAEAPLLRAALATGRPVSATVHMTDRYARTPPPPDLADLLGALAVVLAPSRAIAEHLVEVHGAPAERVVHVPNGVVERPAQPLRERAPGAPLRVGCLARLTRQKGVDVLLDAVAALPPGTVEVAVAGEGRERGDLLARAAGLPVTWAGFTTDTTAFLAGLDAYAQPSREDALPLALLEAAMAGLPCAATRVGDVGDLLGGAVLLTEPEDAGALAGSLHRLADDPALRVRLGAAGRDRVLGGHTEATMAARTARALRAGWEATSRAGVLVGRGG